MSSSIRFSNPNPAFASTLRKEIDAYFKSKQIPLTGNSKLYIKTAVFFSLIFGLYTLLVFFTPPVWVSIICCFVFGLAMAGVGFNVMHDGAHGSYSKNKLVNNLMGYSLNLMGGSVQLWKIKHNFNHHSFTNIEGHDDDIDIRPWIRTCKSQPRKWFHKYQHIYWMILYGFTYLVWVFSKDFQKYFSGKVATVKYKKFTVKEHFIFWLTKVVYGAVFIALPIYMLGFVNWLVGYLIISVVCGFVIAIIFQLAHIIEGASFPDAGVEKSIKEDWFVHQLSTTANFSTRNKWLSWFAGGLNFQVEHHLFPKISHVHYPEVSKVVKDVCQRFNVNYIEYPTLFSALKSHVLYLKEVGRA